VDGETGVRVDNPATFRAMHAPTPDALRDPAAALFDLRSRIGTLVAGRYRILRMIGEGGMGAVFEAEVVPGGTRVAVKIIKPEYSTSQEVNSRFIQEMQAAAAVGHPNIVRTLEAGTDAHGPYMVLELLRGETLCDVLERRPLGPREALDVVAATLEALQAAHAVGIVHRDIKPENIFLVGGADRREAVKLLDFGISKMLSLQSAMGGITRAGTAVGTPDYMSPEQAGGGRIDARADLWSVGAVLYESIAQQHAFEGDTYQQLISNIVLNPHIPLRSRVPAAPSALEAFIDQALRKEPSDRFPSAAAMLAAARQLQAQLPPDESIGFRADEPTSVIRAAPNEPTQVIEVRAPVARPRPAAAPRAADPPRPPEPPRLTDDPRPLAGAPTTTHAAWAQPPTPTLSPGAAPAGSPPSTTLAGRAIPVVAAVAASLVLVALALRFRPATPPAAPVAPPATEPSPLPPPPPVGQAPVPSPPPVGQALVPSPPPVGQALVPSPPPVGQALVPPPPPPRPTVTLSAPRAVFPQRPATLSRRPPSQNIHPNVMASATQTARQLVRPCASQPPYTGPVVAVVTFDAQGAVRNVEMQRPSRVTVNGSCMAARLRQFSLRAAAGQTLPIRFNLPQ
jgi:serine/threonine protein kinase